MNKRKIMFKQSSIFSWLFLCLFALSCSKPSTIDQAMGKGPFDYRNAVFYEIFVQSYADSNGDGIGDFQGLIQKLDYISMLGVDAIWLMPINPSPSYHKYDVVDYRGIHPDYGTLEDFKQFVDEAHRRDIKVVMDFVVNHTSSEHPWFIDAKSGTDAPYRDYYVWAGQEKVADQLEKKATSADSDNWKQWHEADQDSTELYYAFFYGGMPDLNFDNLKVREEVYDIGKYWLEIGVDGFRLDAAKHIYPDDRATDSHAFWEEFKGEMESVNPEVYLIGEVWSTTEEAAPYAGGFCSLFNFDQAGLITYSLDSNYWMAEDGIAALYQAQITSYQKKNPDFMLASFLSNHDQNRIASMIDGDTQKIKQAAAILLTLPGTPYIYYGEEIGMLGMKPDPYLREPMLWGEEDSLQTDWMESRYSLDGSVESVEDQIGDSLSILSLYKELIQLRKSTPVLSLGTIVDMSISNRRLLAYQRKYEEETLVVLHNISGKQIPIHTKSLSGYQEVLWSTGIVFRQDSIVTLDKNSSLIYRVY